VGVRASTYRPAARSPLFPYTTLFRSEPLGLRNTQWRDDYRRIVPGRSSAYRTTDDDGWEIDRPIEDVHGNGGILTTVGDLGIWKDRKSTRLNSSHVKTSYAVFCLKKK